MDDVCLAMVISSNACLDVLAVHDDAVAGPHRTTVPCSVDGGPRARNEPAAQRETCLHRIALVVEHPGRRVAVVEVRMVVTRGVVSPVPGEHVFRIAREPRPRELPARVNLLERRTGVETAERDDVDVAEPSPGGQCGVVRGRDEVCLKMSCKSQYQALCASDRFQVVVEDGNLHAVTPGLRKTSIATACVSGIDRAMEASASVPSRHVDPWRTEYRSVSRVHPAVARPNRSRSYARWWRSSSGMP